MVIKYSWYSRDVQDQLISNNFLSSSGIFVYFRFHHFLSSSLDLQNHFDTFFSEGPPHIHFGTVFIERSPHIYFGIHEKFATASADVESRRE